MEKGTLAGRPWNRPLQMAGQHVETMTCWSLLKRAVIPGGAKRRPGIHRRAPAFYDGFRIGAASPLVLNDGVVLRSPRGAAA
jgi:hypothetical protein